MQMMTSDTLRELNDAEIQQVSGGGKCCCGAANCNTANIDWENGLIIWYNCSGQPVAYQFF
jgi:hypothetical protein